MFVKNLKRAPIYGLRKVSKDQLGRAAIKEQLGLSIGGVKGLPEDGLDGIFL